MQMIKKATPSHGGNMHRRRLIRVASVSAALGLMSSPATVFGEQIFDDERHDYGVPTASALRSAPYKVPTPLRATDVETLTTAELKTMIDAATPPLVIDVRSVPESCLGHPGVRCDDDVLSIPTSLWLPGAGLGGGLDGHFQELFSSRLADYTCGNRLMPIVFLGDSKTDWLPVNASLRAAAIGYRRVYWYRGGRAAWRSAGYPLTRAHIVGTLQPIDLPTSTFCDEGTDYGLAPAGTIRNRNLEAPTPTRVLGASTLTTPRLWSMMLTTKPPVLLDVVGGNQTMTLPGAHWLPGAGRGTGLDDDLQAKFSAELDRLTCGDKSRPIVIFCQSKTCWLSANATFRAVAIGYQSVYWYRGGRCAWQQGLLPSGPVDLLDRGVGSCCANGGAATLSGRRRE